MTVGKPLSGAEMTRVCLIVLLMSNAASVSTQFNGYNCDANYHSRFPGENDPDNICSLFRLETLLFYSDCRYETYDKASVSSGKILLFTIVRYLYFIVEQLYVILHYVMGMKYISKTQPIKLYQ